ncbi:M23 family metallopeptidase [Paenibacillus prosopidis]|uniref:Murein DD-endopeptidase MepM/ murein hydrolase activator NlpD n=1 Tax=Paenibacillus prosopidis TaxID=630520 RepID=A0A368VJZ3_9BACL|nr:M23 family metallopeptidase [Paenibacillus prosopidis]RCW41648.1 murein DD-endopeptidase MepM/ murein hydrolase activator NlpD [Paenibacillus prosopidis]
MPAWAVKIGLQVAQDPEKALKFLFFGIMIIIVLFMLLTLPFFLLFIPAAEPEQYNDYRNAALRIASESGDQLINWQEMIALDAFLLKQDFSKSNPTHIYSYFKEAFIWSEDVKIEVACVPPKKHFICTRTETVYHKRSLDEVMSRLNLSTEDKESVRNYLALNLDDLDDNSEVDGPIDIPPGNFTPVINQFTWPCDVYRVTSGFGTRIDPITGLQGALHGGIDIGTPMGTEVRATAGGVVSFSGYTETGGYMVTVNHQNGYVTRYLHLSVMLVNVGDKVRQNDAIALSGNTGSRTTGPHLHYEIHENGVKKNPLLFYK